MTIRSCRRSCALGLGAPVTLGKVSLCADMPRSVRGSGFVAGLFPLMITGIIAAVGLFYLVPRISARLLGVLLFAALAGIAATAVLQSWPAWSAANSGRSPR